MDMLLVYQQQVFIYFKIKNQKYLQYIYNYIINMFI